MYVGMRKERYTVTRFKGKRVQGCNARKVHGANGYHGTRVQGRVHEYRGKKGTQVQTYEGTRVQGCKVERIKGYKCTRLQGYRGPSV